MSAITGAGYWRITTNPQGIIDAELLDDEDGHRQLLEGEPIVRVESNGLGLVGYQNSGAILQLPGGQAVPNATQFSLTWDHE